MRILYLTQRVPYPPNRGDKILTYHQIRHLAGKHEVAVACLAEDKEDLANVDGLASITASVDVIPLHRTRARTRALGALCGSRPLTVAYFDEFQLRKLVEQRVANSAFDGIIVCSSGMAQYVEEHSGIPRIMQFTDLDSLKWKQYAEKCYPPKRWIYQLEYKRLLEYERILANTFDHSIVCTPSELDDLKRLIPNAPASCVCNGVDLDYFQPMAVPKKANSLIFTGVMDYYPNIEGVMWFCKEVLPIIREEIPEASFKICGARSTKAVTALGEIPGVSVTGRVPDVRPHLAESSVAVVPLRIARGIQNKLLEAMAMGLAAVTTTSAFKGVEAQPDQHLFVADEAEAFAEKVLRLLKDEELRIEVGQAARSVIEDRYRWEVQLRRLEDILEQAAANCWGSKETANV